MLELAKAARLKKWYEAAVRLYSQAFAADPKFVMRLNGHRYNAACAAALCRCAKAGGCGGVSLSLEHFGSPDAAFVVQLGSHGRKPDVISSGESYGGRKQFIIACACGASSVRGGAKLGACSGGSISLECFSAPGGCHVLRAGHRGRSSAIIRSGAARSS